MITVVSTSASFIQFKTVLCAAREWAAV